MECNILAAISNRRDSKRKLSKEEIQKSIDNNNNYTDNFSDIFEETFTVLSGVLADPVYKPIPCISRGRFSEAKFHVFTYILLFV